MPFGFVSIQLKDNTNSAGTLREQSGTNRLSVEDWVGFQLQAMVANPDGRTRFWDNIQDTLAASAGRLDWRLLEEYFHLFERQEDFCHLQQRHSPDSRGVYAERAFRPFGASAV